MKTTTIYHECLTITTDDDGTRTVTRSSYADTETAYLFTEPSPEAQQRAINDAIEEETSVDNWYCSQSYFAEEEIWQAAHDLEKQQPVRFYSDQGGSPAAEARAKSWNSWGTCVEVTEATDTGIVYSMDICDTWNRYATRIMALVEAAEEAYNRYETHEDNADNAADNGNIKIAEAERRRATFYEDMAARIENTAEELTEEAARAVGDVVDGLIECERDYYSSEEFWREWLTDSDDRYTREGERI